MERTLNWQDWGMHSGSDSTKPRELPPCLYLASVAAAFIMDTHGMSTTGLLLTTSVLKRTPERDNQTSVCVACLRECLVTPTLALLCL